MDCNANEYFTFVRDVKSENVFIELLRLFNFKLFYMINNKYISYLFFSDLKGLEVYLIFILRLFVMIQEMFLL